MSDEGIVEAQQFISDYYILEYYTTNAARDGKFRRVKVSLNTDATAKLEYRQVVSDPFILDPSG
jgi:hypothetical protein